jgi:hypothetical protein
VRLRRRAHAGSCSPAPGYAIISIAHITTSDPQLCSAAATPVSSRVGHCERLPGRRARPPVLLVAIHHWCRRRRNPPTLPPAIFQSPTIDPSSAGQVNGGVPGEQRAGRVVSSVTAPVFFGHQAAHPPGDLGGEPLAPPFPCCTPLGPLYLLAAPAAGERVTEARQAQPSHTLALPGSR